jgi:putative ABC transport system permease protein
MRLYLKLALSSIRSNRKIYLPYLLACILTVMMFYMVESLSLNPGLEQLIGADVIAYTLSLGTYIIGLFAVIFLLYTNSFLMKRRKMEFGLFNVLGMEKKHLGKLLALETCLVAAVSLAVGIFLGIALDKVMFLLITKIIGGPVKLGFFVSPQAIAATAALFGSIFLIIFLKALVTVARSKPVELLQGGSVGEKEPKARWLLALLGLISLGVGYWLALTVKDPVASLTVFFVAVILVILGTYLLFTAGSIALLKLLRRNQKFYYQTKHFISVSGMIYRMKQNAVGLANICILATMVLVMLSTTTSLMLGMEEVIRTRYPNDFGIYSQDDDADRTQEAFAAVDDLFAELEIPITDRVQYTVTTLYAFQRGEELVTTKENSDLWDEVNNYRVVTLMPLSDYNAFTGENCTLGAQEILFYANRTDYDGDTLRLFGEEYTIASHLKKFAGCGTTNSNVFTGYYCILRDQDYAQLTETALADSDVYVGTYTYYGLDTTAGQAVQSEANDQLLDLLARLEFQGYTESRTESRIGILGLYGGLFFLGIFLGALFTMATVLIIYYKQISEGYDDRERFQIMQQVGLTRQEVKRAIHSQVLTVFFLPLGAAAVHVAVAFPMITLLLALLNMNNIRLYLGCTVGSFLAFALLYVVIYSLTARTYYKIVSQ